MPALAKGPSEAERSEETAASEGKPKKTKKKSVELFGRIVTRAVAQERESTLLAEEYSALDLSVWQARIGAKAQGPVEWLTAEVEADFARKPRLKDGFIQAKSSWLRARLGQFRAPMTAIDSESSWDLPVVDRGLMNEILTERLELAGRRPGLALWARASNGPRPRLMLGAFQGSNLVNPETVDTELLSEIELGSQTLIARVDLDFGSVEPSAFYAHRVGTPRTLREGDAPPHYPAGGVDLVVDHDTAGGGLRLWATAVVGTSWYDHVDESHDATFATARVLTAVRWGGTRREELFVEPYLQSGVIDPDLDVVADLAWEQEVGVHVGAWDRARIGLEASFTQAMRNFPKSYRIERLLDRRAITLQAGMVF